MNSNPVEQQRLFRSSNYNELVCYLHRGINPATMDWYQKYSLDITMPDSITSMSGRLRGGGVEKLPTAIRIPVFQDKIQLFTGAATAR